MGFGKDLPGHYSINPTNATYPAHSTEADAVFGCLYAACFLIGLPANITSCRYFYSKQKERAISLFLLMLVSINDSFICFMAFFQIPVMFTDRDSSFYEGTYNCVIWMNIYQLLTRMSVALTATLSVLRTLSIVRPHKTFQKRRIFVGLLCYGSFILLMTAIPCSLGLQYGTYEQSGAMCWLLHAESEIGEVWDYVDNAVDSLALFAPIIPVTISCAISTYGLVFTAIPAGNKSDKKRKATVTILILTAAYVMFNIPLFVCYVLWMISDYDTYPDPYFSSRLMYNYAWNFTEVLSVALNSLCNPFIFFCRIQLFRDFVSLDICQQGADQSSSAVVAVKPVKDCTDSGVSGAKLQEDFKGASRSKTLQTEVSSTE